MNDNVNKDIYEKNYSDKNVSLTNVILPYDQWMVKYRFSLINKYGKNKDVLDLCCGTGSYLIPMVNQIRLAIGVDFSSTMLGGFQKNLKCGFPTNLNLIKADAMILPLKDRTMDFVYSYTSLYHVPNVELSLYEIGRVLRPGGYAVVELGNTYSINTIVCKVQYHYGWANPYHISYPKMLQYIEKANLNIVEHRAFQLLNTLVTPIEIFFLFPLSNPFWKHILGIEFRGRMLDEWISSSRLFQNLAFRHIFIVQKQENHDT